MKKYMSPQGLLDYIISKGVIVSDKEKALERISKYSYYSIVNSYKDVFKNIDGSYKEGVHFDEIYSLYEFDKNLRIIFLKYILEIETIIKSLLSEVISLKYGIENYLCVDNFDNSIDISVRKEFINKIEVEIKKQYNKNELVTHYINKYGFIPPFVLTKILTLGELSKLYAILKQDDRQSISKQFKISDKLLKQVMINMTMIRNKCAHNDRLFSFHSKFLITFKNVDKNYNNKDRSTNLYMIMKSMMILLDKEKKCEFEDLMNIEISTLKNNIKSISINNILYLMGFYE